MKKLVLVAAGLMMGATVMAQHQDAPINLNIDVANTTQGGSEINTHRLPANKNGDSLTRLHVTSSSTFNLYYYGSAPFDSGYNNGFNAFGDKAWAERFDIRGSDSSVQPAVVFGYLYGSANSGSTKTVRANIWAQGTRALIPGSTRIRVDGLPTTILSSSSTVTMGQLRTSASDPSIDTVIYMRLPATTPYVADTFFAGFEVPSGYTFNSLNGDTLAVVSTTSGTRYGTGTGNNLVTSPPYRYVGTDTTITVQNASQAGNGTWGENLYFKTGRYQNLVVGVSFRVRTLSVTGITRNDLTVFGTVPNPAVNGTSLKMSLQVPSSVMLYVVDNNGRNVYTAPAQQLSAGEHMLPIPTENLASGVYHCMVRTTSGAIMGIEFNVIK
jgi:hypothetical protein